MKKWNNDGFGLNGDHTHGFFPLTFTGNDADDENNHVHPGWVRTRQAASTGVCPSLLKVKVPSGGLVGANVRVVFAKKTQEPAKGQHPSGAIGHDHCALLAFAYLAAQPEVMRVLCYTEPGNILKHIQLM